MAASPDNWSKLRETRQRLEKCWKLDIDWSLYPQEIKEVMFTFETCKVSLSVPFKIFSEDCLQVPSSAPSLLSYNYPRDSYGNPG